MKNIDLNTTGEWQPILDYWFGSFDNELSDRAHQQRWYSASVQTDQEMTSRFAGMLLDAEQGKYDGWAQSPTGRLALILLFDQFSRNIYRGQARAFAFDPLALKLCQQGLAMGHDKKLNLTERLFFYHPLEHAENREAQALSVAEFVHLSEQYPKGEAHRQAANALKFAIEHRDIIDRFGRFPHRNQVLGRENTPEEQAYLDAGAKRFGQ